MDVGDWCAVYCRMVGGPDYVSPGFEFFGVDRLRNEADLGEVDVGEATVDNAVLVDIPEGVELFERPRPVRSLVRLRPIEDCPSVAGDPTAESVVGQLRWIVKERPLDHPGDVGLPQRLDGVGAAGQKPRGLVEGGAQVVEKVTNHDTESERHGLSNAQKDRITCRIRLELSGDVIRLRLEEHLTAEIESFQVFDRPINLGPRSR